MKFSDILNANIFSRIEDAKSTRQETVTALEELHAERMRIQGEIGRLVMAPTDRADVEAMLSNWVSDNAAEFHLEMAERVMPFVRDARALENPRLIATYINFAGGDDAPRAGLERAICAAMGKQLATAMLSSLSRIDWPEKSVTLVDRQRRIAALEERDRAAQQEQARLTTALEQSGMRY